ncbi:hypothetical protein D3C86_1782960 [compost metagenome]
MYRFVSAKSVAYRPGRTRVGGGRDQRIIFSFAVQFANRMNGRKVKRVETHFGNFRQQPKYVAKCAVFSRNLSCRPREKLVPCAETGFFTLDFEAKCSVKNADAISVTNL